MGVIKLSLPKDPVILLSYVNTQLRNNYNSLDDFLKSNGIEKHYIVNILSSINYFYNDKLNQFV